MFNSAKEVVRAFRAIFWFILDLLFDSDHNQPISKEGREILSNPEDRKKYTEALRTLDEPGVMEVTIILSSGNKLTLVN